MTNSCDPFSRRDFLKTLGLATLPMLNQGCDAEPPPSSFRGKPQSPGKPGASKTKTSEVAIARALLEQPLIDDRQRCSLPAKLGNMTGIGRQVRIIREGWGPALFTVDELRDADNPATARIGLEGRHRLGTSALFDAIVSTAVTASGLSDAQAQAQGELVERLVDDGHNDGLVVLAVHGGAIEPYTDLQAEQLTAAMAPYGASSWICKGWRPGASAFEAWHIRSSDLSPYSFAGLGTLSKRKFAYAVSFHGMAGNAGVLIGGGGPSDIKQQIADAIRAVIDTSIPVSVAKPSDIFDGDDEANIVNWLTAGGSGGFQIEQDYRARKDHGSAIASAIAKVLATLL